MKNYQTRILLTGGNGMVGKNLLEHKRIAEFEVFAPSRKKLDLRNYEEVLHYFSRIQPTIVIHAAGKVGGIQANIREPVAFLEENLIIGRNVVMAAKESKIERLINLGSSCMYPRNYDEPLHEDLLLTGQLEPTNEGYALAKIVTAKLCSYVTKEDKNLQYKTIIPCNIFGRYDSFDPSKSHLLPAIIHKIHHAKIQGANSVQVWGDGKARREFMYAADLANAILYAIENFDTMPHVLNIGMGCDHTITEYYEAVARVIGYSGSLEYDRSKPVGMARKLVSTEKQLAWGWAPSYSLRDGIQHSYQYYLQHHAI